MSNPKIGLFFGTETGTTRLIAKKIYKLLGDEIAAKPVNVNRIQPQDLLQYEALILGTPSYGVGDIPGLSAGCLERNWEEFLQLLGQEGSVSLKAGGATGPEWKTHRVFRVGCSGALR